MVSFGEILRADPSRISFEGKRPPVIGEVPAHTYRVLESTRNLELLDGPEQNITSDTHSIENVLAEQSTLTREESLRREIQSVADIHQIPTTGVVEKEDNILVFEARPSVRTTTEPEPEFSGPSTQIREKPFVPVNRQNRVDNLRIFSGQRGRIVYERGRVVNTKKTRAV